MKNLLKEERLRRRLKQYILARKCGIHYTRLSRIENEIDNPSPREMRRLSRALKLEVSELFPPPESSKVSIPSDER